jgi:hypothetical protein
MHNYEAAHRRFRQAYEDLFDLMANYPEDFRTKPGACGSWSPKQVLAHFCGWITEAHRRYSAFAAGDEDDITYEDHDAMNSQAVVKREFKDWNTVMSELRGLVQDLSSRAEAVPPSITADDHRYSQWLNSLGDDCEYHTAQLRDFMER